MSFIVIMLQTVMSGSGGARHRYVWVIHTNIHLCVAPYIRMYGIWTYMSGSRHLCLKPDTYVWAIHTNIHLCMAPYIRMYGPYIGMYGIWPFMSETNQTLMSVTIPISLGHTCMYEFYSHICMETTHLCVRSYIYVWARHIGVSDWSPLGLSRGTLWLK